MRLRHFLSWKFEYVFVAPEQWQREHEKHFVLTKYDLLSVWDATTVLRQLAHRDPKFLAELARAVLVMPVRPGLEPMVQELIRALGRPNSRAEEPPDFASFYVARRKRERTFPELPDPGKEHREKIEAAEKAPRGFVVVEVVDEDERPVSGIRLEVLLADGQFRTLTTNAEGTASLDPIPQGQCHIRLPQLDGSSWRPAEGPASTRVDKGHARLHVVRQGENLTRIAKQYGIHGWKKLWDHADNQKLRARRKNPHILCPGDQVAIPPLQIHQISRPTDQTHRIVTTEEPAEFRVILCDHNQLPYKAEPYELRLSDRDDETPRTGTTGTDGKVVEQLRASERKVWLHLPGPDLRWTFELHEDLLPLPTPEGLEDESEHCRGEVAVRALQGRLNRLGFPCGSVDGKFGPMTQAALALLSNKPPDHEVGVTKEIATDVTEPEPVMVARVGDMFEGLA
jgi:hypothetical protein